MSRSVVALINPESIAYSHVVNYRLGESLESVDKATQWHLQLTLLIDSLQQAIGCPNFSETPHANNRTKNRETKEERASPFVCCFVKRAVSGKKRPNQFHPDPVLVTVRLFGSGDNIISRIRCLETSIHCQDSLKADHDSRLDHGTS